MKRVIAHIVLIPIYLGIFFAIIILSPILIFIWALDVIYSKEVIPEKNKIN